MMHDVSAQTPATKSAGVPERVCGDPAFIRLSGVPSAGLHGRLDALTTGSGDSRAIEDGQGHGGAVTSPAALAVGKPDCTGRLPILGVREGNAVNGRMENAVLWQHRSNIVSHAE